jgi:prepilin-type N-terminal cleavage/methylation domain-containing protein
LARGFSIVEMLVALMISSTLMTAMMVALDFMFKRYTLISDSASTHVVARTVMHRILSMIRTGTQFAPSPAGELIYDQAHNPFDSDRIQFISVNDSARVVRTTVETRVPSTMSANGESVELRGPYVLWLITSTTTPSGTTVEERPLLDGIARSEWINLYFDVGNRIKRATIDLEVLPAGNVIAEQSGGQTWRTTVDTDTNGGKIDRRLIALDQATPTIRLVGSVSPRGDD